MDDDVRAAKQAEPCHARQGHAGSARSTSPLALLLPRLGAMTVQTRSVKAAPRNRGNAKAIRYALPVGSKAATSSALLASIIGQ